MPNTLPTYTSLDAYERTEGNAPPLPPRSFEEVLQETVKRITTSIMTEGLTQLEVEVQVAMQEAVDREEREVAWNAYQLAKKRKKPSKAKRPVKKKNVKKARKK